MLYSSSESRLFQKLSNPASIQDFINDLKINFEKRGETCRSPRFVLRNGEAHCMEGAMLAAAILEFHGQKPYVMDLRSVKHDQDHVVAVFKRGKYIGAISKTNHAVLRYREPIYKNLRELALSYFHEYFDSKGRKTLREYSRLLDLQIFDRTPSFIKEFGNWRISEKDLFDIPAGLDEIKHYYLINPNQIKKLRKADKVEIKAGEITEY
jgi:hypothetical protein